MLIKLNMRGKLRCRLMIDRVLERDLHMHLGNCSGLEMVEHCMCALRIFMWPSGLNDTPSGLDFTPCGEQPHIRDDTPVVVVLHGLTGGAFIVPCYAPQSDTCQ